MSSQFDKAKFLWRCKRGMLELDILLGNFVAAEFDKLNEEQITALANLLKEPDPDIFNWLMGYSKPQKKGIQSIVKLIQLKSDFK